jgi:hypothetical protein
MLPVQHLHSQLAISSANASTELDMSGYTYVTLVLAFTASKHVCYDLMT